MNGLERMRHVPTPLGTVLLSARDGALVSARFVDSIEQVNPPVASADPVLDRAAAALARYFAGHDLHQGDEAEGVPLAPVGTPFQRKVWDAILSIPYGQTTTYTGIAQSIGAPRAVRAVGAATGRNPLWLFVPCHRVIGRGGALTGYAGGIERKRALLALEHHGRG